VLNTKVVCTQRYGFYSLRFREFTRKGAGSRALIPNIMYHLVIHSNTPEFIDLGSYIGDTSSRRWIIREESSQMVQGEKNTEEEDKDSTSFVIP
jgi:hypothetical protein